MAWSLLNSEERKNAFFVLIVVMFSALSSAIMVGSVVPFLSVLSDPDQIRDVPALSLAYKLGGFTSDYDFLLALGAVSLAIIILTSILQFLRMLVIARFATMRIHTISYRLLSAYLQQPYEFFLDKNAGNLSTKVLSEAQEVVQRFFRPMMEVTAASLTILAIVSLILWINFQVSLLVFVIVGSAYAALFYFSRNTIRELGLKRVDANSTRYRIAGEALGGIKDLKLFGREAFYLKRFNEPSLSVARTQAAVAVLGQAPQYLIQAVAFGGMIVLSLVLLDEAGLVSGNALSGILPLLGVLAFSGQRLMPELSKLYYGLTELTYGAAAVENVHRDLMLTNHVKPLPKTDPKPIACAGALHLDDVSYRYPGATNLSLKRINLVIQPGERVGIVGGTGAGKTTLADILLGLLRPTEGRLVAAGLEISDNQIRAWQKSIGYVPQEIFLADATVSQNIAFGIPPSEIDQARVERAAQMAKIDVFIREELDRGYDTSVGERGIRLSGGQKQRIGIARALYHDPFMIVFDEATSALDNLTEREVMRAIEAIPGNKSVVFIAHRLSTVRPCDKIVVMNHGEVVGCGTWEDLMNSNEPFRKIALQT